MVAAKKTKKTQESINNRLALVMKSKKYTLGYKTVLKYLRSSKENGRPERKFRKLISYLQLNSIKNGDHLATGDCGDRVVLFERTDTQDHVAHRRDLEKMDYPINRHPEFRYKTEFQSHEPEFDYLKSLEIEEKINKIRWCQSSNGALFLLSTNDRTIKLWKVQEKKVKKVCNMNVDSTKAMGNGPIVGSSISTSSKQYIANGGCTSNDFSFPTGGFPSLHLPVAVFDMPILLLYGLLI
ncbi:hypothetical protein GOBAR_DD04064 [Gossypium barbadense]|nr:hypothetical protein GOBAR_DD04064 [Gossypium barbadense]